MPRVTFHITLTYNYPTPPEPRPQPVPGPHLLSTMLNAAEQAGSYALSGYATVSSGGIHYEIEEASPTQIP